MEFGLKYLLNAGRAEGDQLTTNGVPGAVSNLRAEYYYYRGENDCFRAALRISWSSPHVGLLIRRFVISPSL